MIKSKLKLFFFIYIFLFLSPVFSSQLMDEFNDVLINQKECTENSFKFIADENELKEYFKISEVGSLDVVKRILRNYCNPTDDKNFFIDITKKIISQNNDESSTLLFINLVQSFMESNRFTSTSEILFELSEQLLALMQINQTQINEQKNWHLVIYYLGAFAQLFSESYYSDDLLNDVTDHHETASTYIGILEKLILDNLSDKIEKSNSKLIATTLLDLRILKFENLSVYASEKESSSYREFLATIYLSKIKNDSISYTEFYSIMSSSNSPKDEYWIIDLPISLNQIGYLVDISMHDYVSIGVENFPRNKFINTLGNLLISKFDEDPEYVLTSLYKTFEISFNYCDLKDKDLKSDINEFEKLNTKLNLYKFICTRDIKYAEDALTFIKNNPSEGYFNTLLVYRIVILFSSEIFNDPKFNLKAFLDYFIEVSYPYINYNLLELDEIDFSNIFLLTLNDLLNDTGIVLSPKSKNILKDIQNEALFNPKGLINSIKADPNYIGENVTERLKYITVFLASLQTKVYGTNYGFSASGHIEKKISELSLLSSDHKIINESKNILELIDFLISYIQDQNNTPDNNDQLLISNPPSETWNLFKELITMEGYIYYLLISSKHISYIDFQELSVLRYTQLLSLRPNQIALNKFKSDFINNIDDQNIKSLFIEFDGLQRGKQYINELNLTLSGKEIETSGSERQRIELLYKNEINRIQRNIINSKDSSDELMPFLQPLLDYSYLDIESLASKLNKNELMMSLIVGSSSSIIYFLHEGRIVPYPLEAGIGEFNVNKKFLMEEFSSPSDDIFMRPVYELSSLIINPLDIIKGRDIEHIYFIGDQALSDLPIHALLLKDGRYAIQKYSFSYLSSEKLITQLNLTNISPEYKFVGFGNPVLGENKLVTSINDLFNKRGELNIQKLDELVSLPETETELRNISKFFRNSDIYTQDDAIENNLSKPTVSNAEVIAFATHAIKGGNKSFNDRGLVLTPRDENDYSNDGFLSSFEIKTLKLNNNPSVILTACNIVETPFYNAEPFAGISGSFMEAGAQSVVLSLWNIDSISAKQFNESLFKNKDDDFLLRNAMQDAMISMINSDNYNHPYYWAAYTHLGR